MVFGYHQEVKMKATLEFDLPEDRSEHELACKASGLYCFQFDTFNRIREYLKYEELKPNQAEILEELRDTLRDSEVHFECEQ